VPLDAHGDHSEPLVGRQGVSGVHEAGRMKPSSYYDRVVDVMEELMEFTLLVRGRADYLVDRYSERKAAEAEAVRLAEAAMAHEKEAERT